MTQLAPKVNKELAALEKCAAGSNRVLQRYRQQ